MTAVATEVVRKSQEVGASWRIKLIPYERLFAKR